MNAIAIDALPPFDEGGRGPVLQRWLHDSDLLFADSNEGFGSSSGSIMGALVEGNVWVVFHGLQVIQIVPDEVNSGWYLPHESVSQRSNVWRVEESSWLKSFDQQHLAKQSHFIVEFYDEVVEVICCELLFGKGGFDLPNAIDIYPQLGYAYLRRAISMEKQGHTKQAIDDYEKYVCLGGEGSEYASRRLRAIREKSGL